MDFTSTASPIPGAPPHFAPVILDGWLMPYATSGAAGQLGAGVSTAWPANNKAYFYPFTLGIWVTVYQLFFWVGATSSGTIDVGIYDDQKNKIITAGSTAMSATINTVQTLNVTDTVLAPGDYFVAGVCSTTGGTCFRAGNAAADEIFLATGVAYEQAVGSSTLPDPCTPVAVTDATPSVWSFGAICSSVF